jgi:glycosyltransferase involved in cell wall biosynthesis
MTTLMVTPYAPYRDGIAAYAVQEVRRLRGAGVDIEVLSPLPSAAQYHLSLGGVRGMLALARRASRFDDVVLQFSPEMIFGACRGPAERVAVWAALGLVARRTRLEIRLHEIEYGPLARNPLERQMAARVLRAAASVTVHTQREVDELAKRIGLDPGVVTLVDHGASFSAATAISQAEARVELGLDPDEHVFLAIGFLQAHKGYDVAVEAFGRANLSAQASLHVVGSVRVDHPDLLAYARHLELLCRVTTGAHLHQKYVSDEEFDRWIVAADTVVLPYREIWSSGVLERAKLFNRTVIAADVGGIGDQARSGTLFFTDTESLVQALKERAQSTAVRLALDGRSHHDGPADQADSWSFNRAAPQRDEIEAQIRRRVRSQRLDQVPELAGGGRSALDPLLALGSLQRPPAVSARPGVTQVKRLIRRVVNWELAPVVVQLEALRRATIESISALEARCPIDVDEQADA